MSYEKFEAALLELESSAKCVNNGKFVIVNYLNGKAWSRFLSEYTYKFEEILNNIKCNLRYE